MRVCLFFSLCVTVVYGAAGPAPVVLWSPREGAFADHGDVRQSVEPGLNRAEDLVEWMHKPQRPVGEESPFKTFVVLMNEARDGILDRLEDFPQVNERIRKAGSSMVVPAVPRDDFHAHLTARIPPANQVAAGHGPLTGREELRRGAERPHGHDVVLVTVPEHKQGDAELAMLLDQVSEATQGNYALAMLMKPLAEFTEKHAALMLERQGLKPSGRRLSSSSSDTKQYVRMTPDILAGLLTGILLLFITLIGFTCLSAIQTPSKFTDVPPPSTKEY